MMGTTARPNIAVIGLGGTIAMRPAGSATGAVPAMTATDLLATVPGLDELDVTLESITFRSLPSAALTLDDLDALAGLVERLADRGVDGVVVTTGTDSLEETAFFLDITVSGDLPIVVTGAMRNPGVAGADGPANLLAAIHVAASTEARGRGCLVVMADEIHAARYVRKTHSASVAAFKSPDLGPVGHVVEGRPWFLVQPGLRVVIARPASPSRAAVTIVSVSLGDDLPLLRPRRDDLDGLVVSAFGVGHVPASVVELLADYAARMPVVLASRTGAGPIHRAAYAFPGSEIDLQRRGLINAGYLDPYKSRILLGLLIDAGGDQITDMFDRVNA